MKRLLVGTALLCTLVAAGQKNFEGKVRYSVSVFEELNGDPGEMTIFFGKPGIRLEFISSASPAKNHEVLLFNFDSGLLITLKPNLRTYTKSPLHQQGWTPSFAPKTVAGYHTQPVLLQPSRFLKDASDLFGTAVLYPADSLVYALPARFAGNPELMMVQKDRVVLEGRFYSKIYPRQPNPRNYPMPQLKDTALLFTATAEDVLQQPVPDSLFLPGAAYSDQQTLWSNAVDSTDSIAVIQERAIDSAVREAQHATPKAKTKRTLKKKSTPPKNPVYRKEN